MLRKTAFFLIIGFIIQILSGFVAAASVPFRDLAAHSAILAEKDNGIILYENNIHSRHPADALAKVMTLLLASYAVENDQISDHELITMTETAWYDLDSNSTTQNIQAGETMTFIDLMYSAYTGNSNEACNMLALRIAGSINAFALMMNALAREIGAENTNFVNPHGQYHESQYTTAYDQFIIFSEAMNSPLFAEIASTFRHITESNEDSETRTLTTTNALLNQSSRYYYRHSIAGRDSATYEGGHSLISMAEENGLTLISVVLGSNVLVFDDDSTDMRSFSETLRLYQWGFTQFAWRDILKTTDLLARVRVEHGSGAVFVNARPEGSLSLLLDNSVPSEVFVRTITIYSEQRGETLVAPISAGEVLGEVVISRDGVEQARIPLVANTDINLSGIEYIRGQVTSMLETRLARNIMIILGIILLLYIGLVIRYNIVRAGRMRRIKNAKDDIIRQRQENFRDY